MLPWQALCLLGAVAAQQIATSYDTTCAITGDSGAPQGVVTCFGNPAEHNVTVGLDDFVAIYAYEYFCAIRTTQQAVCWGPNAPDLSSETSVIKLALSASQTAPWGCGLRSTGDIFCFDTQTSFVGSDFVDIEGGYDHVCAIRQDGTAECLTEAVQPIFTPDPTETWLQLACGESFCCGLRGIDAQLSCNGTSTWLDALPVLEDPTSLYVSQFYACALHASGYPLCWGEDIPRALPQEPFVQLALGLTFQEHACGVGSSGAMQCWPESTAVPVIDLKSFHVGDSTTTRCGLSLSDTLVCWGTAFSTTVPPELRIVPFSMVATNGGLFCAVRIADGGIVCFDRLGIVLIDNTEFGFTQVSVGSGGLFACGIRTGGEVRCWLGRFVFDATALFAAIPSANPLWNQLTCGEQFCCVNGFGGVKCWGSIILDTSVQYTAISAGTISVCALPTEESEPAVRCWKRSRADASAPFVSQNQYSDWSPYFQRFQGISCSDTLCCVNDEKTHFHCWPSDDLPSNVFPDATPAKRLPDHHWTDSCSNNYQAPDEFSELSASSSNICLRSETWGWCCGEEAASFALPSVRPASLASRGMYRVGVEERLCPNGTFGEHTGYTSPRCSGCCPAGVLSGGAFDCTEACPIGYYCPRCAPVPLQCPGGTFGVNAALSTSLCSGLCPLGYYCPIGTQSPVLNPCPVGTYGDVMGLSSPACSGVCLPGYFCPLGSTSATQSACGSVSLYCPNGTQSILTADAGSYTVGPSTCPGGTPDDPTECRMGVLQCGPGFACSGGVRKECGPGTYAAGYGSESCSACVPGRSSDIFGATECNGCSPGRFARSFGMQSCHGCDAGGFSGSNASECTACEPGRTSSELASSCVDCKAGRFAPFVRSSGCTTCLAGSFSLDKASQCQPCASGYFSDTEQASSCTPCPPFTVSAGNGSTSCTPCSGLDKAGACIACPEGVSCLSGAVVANKGYWIGSRVDALVAATRCRAGACKAPEECGLREVNASARTCCGPGLKQPTLLNENYLCGECLEGWSKWGGKCVKCDSSNGSLVLLLLLGSWAYIITLHYLTQMSFSGQVRAVVYFLQMATVMIQPVVLPDNWVSWLGVIDLSANSVGSNCIAPITPIGNALLGLLMPVTGVCFLLLTMGVHWLAIFLANTRCGRPIVQCTRKLGHCCSRCLRGCLDCGGQCLACCGAKYDAREMDDREIRSDKSDDDNRPTPKYRKSSYLRTLLAVMLFSYNSVTNTVISFLNCKSVSDGTRLVAAEPALKCDSPAYLAWFPFIMFLLIVVVIGLPIGMLVILSLARRSGRLPDSRAGAPKDIMELREKFQKRYGIIFEAYKEDLFWWEVVVLVRRTVIIAASATTTDSAVRMYTGVCFLHLTSIVIHQYKMPYKDPFTNHFENALMMLLMLMCLFLARTGFEPTLTERLVLSIFVYLTLSVAGAALAWTSKPGKKVRSRITTVGRNSYSKSRCCSSLLDCFAVLPREMARSEIELAERECNPACPSHCFRATVALPHGGEATVRGVSGAADVER